MQLCPAHSRQLQVRHTVFKKEFENYQEYLSLFLLFSFSAALVEA
jgi:hypothetical protein